MPDSFSTVMTAAAMVEADEARRAAELAEMRAFVNGYSHHNATPAERDRYVESVRVLYPQPAKESRPMTTAEKQVLGGIIVGLFVWIAAGAAIGKFVYGDVETGVNYAIASLMVCIGCAFVLGILAIGVCLLLGYG